MHIDIHSLARQCWTALKTYEAAHETATAPKADKTNGYLRCKIRETGATPTGPSPQTCLSLIDTPGSIQ